MYDTCVRWKYSPPTRASNGEYGNPFWAVTFSCRECCRRSEQRRLPCIRTLYTIRVHCWNANFNHISQPNRIRVYLPRTPAQIYFLSIRVKREKNSPVLNIITNRTALANDSEPLTDHHQYGVHAVTIFHTPRTTISLVHVAFLMTTPLTNR